MRFYIVPCKDDSYGFVPGYQPMKPWPSLAGKAFCLKDNTRPAETLFFFDAMPSNDAAPEAGISDPPSPVFVLIHGLGDEADSWRHLIPLLNAHGFRVLAPDLPGFGRSVAAGKISIKGHVAAVLKLIEAAALPPSGHPDKAPPVFLSGNSMGAVIAEAAAIQKPTLVRGLVLLDGSIPGGPSNPGLFALARLLFSRKWYRAYRDNPEAAWLSLYPYYADLDALPPADKDFLWQRVMARVESPSQEQAFFATQRSLVRMYLTGVSRIARGIQSYKGKILLIWGGKDRIIPLSSASVFMTLRPDAKLEIIPGAGHLPHQEKPEELARIMAEFGRG